MKVKKHIRFRPTKKKKKDKKKSSSSSRAGNPGWKPGVSGNPKGRPPKGESIAERLRAIGDEEIQVKTAEGKIVKMDRKSLVLRRVYDEATKGDKNAYEFIAERTEGKVTQPVEIKKPRKFIITGE